MIICYLGIKPTLFQSNPLNKRGIVTHIDQALNMTKRKRNNYINYLYFLSKLPKARNNQEAKN